MTKVETVQFRECLECHLWFERARYIRCDLCRKIFCLDCYGNWHVWRCPKNSEPALKGFDHGSKS